MTFLLWLLAINIIAIPVSIYVFCTLDEKEDAPYDDFSL